MAKCSTNAGVHPYLKPDFEFETPQQEVKSLGTLATDEELKEIIDKKRKERTFYFNHEICESLGGLSYGTRGAKITINKKSDLLKLSIIKIHWDKHHIERWKNLIEKDDEPITLVNNGTSWWTAESSFIKMK